MADTPQFEHVLDRLTEAGVAVKLFGIPETTGGPVWLVDAQCPAGRRFIVRTDDLLGGFLELEAEVGARPIR